MNDSEFILWKNNVSKKFMEMSVKFFKTSKMMFEKLVNEGTPKYLDQLIFPCLYSFRHSLELVLKYVLIVECKDKEEVITMLATNKHNLVTLFDDVKQILVLNTSDSIEFKKLIDYIDKVDPDSDFFRYPFGLFGSYNFENQVWIDLVKLFNAFEISEFLFDLMINDNKTKFKGNSKAIDFVSETQVNYRIFSTIGTGGLSKSFRYQMNGFNKAAEFLIEYDDYYFQRLYFERLSIELVLKDIIYYIMTDDAFKIFRNKKHKIIGLWNKVVSILEDLGDGRGPTIELSNVTELCEIGEVLKKVHDQDVNSDEFRYPIKMDGNSNLSMVEENIEDIFDKGSLFRRLEIYDNVVIASDLNNKGMSLFDYLLEL
ncbi:MAG: hypothetical protein JEZ05_01560 [Tenericutes bacterium]|nr:hypothetical protein [Mycoplasmatota bacterium]